MASPIPCAVCEQVADADWLVTARTEATGFPLGTTIGLCMDCWIGMALAKAQAQVEQLAEADAEHTVGPGVLEMIEMDETRPAEDRPGSQGRKSRAKAESNGQKAAEAEAASADVDQ